MKFLKSLLAGLGGYLLLGLASWVLVFVVTGRFPRGLGYDPGILEGLALFLVGWPMLLILALLG